VKPIVKNASDEAQVKGAEEKQKRAGEREMDDVKNVLATDSGRRFCWKYLERTGVFRSSFTGNSTTFYNEGMRNIGLMLMADITSADPAAFLLMMQENKHV
jgi:hypothetical protein